MPQDFDDADQASPQSLAAASLDHAHHWALVASVFVQLLIVGSAWGHTPLMAQLMAGYLGAAVVGICALSLAERGVAPEVATSLSALGTLGYVLLAGRWTHWAPPFWLGVALLGLLFASGDRGWSRLRLGVILAVVGALATSGTHRPVEVLGWLAAAAAPYAALELWLAHQRRTAVDIEASFGLAPQRG